MANEISFMERMKEAMGGVGVGGPGGPSGAGRGRDTLDVSPGSGICARMHGYSFRLSTDPIPQTATTFADGEGADVQFLGTVRGEEDGKPITGIDYSVYQGMAEKELEKLCERGQREMGPHRVEIQHRLGFVAAREPSIIIRVKTRHSAEAFEVCRWYLKEVKTTVPIWKKPVFA